MCFLCVLCFCVLLNITNSKDSVLPNSMGCYLGIFFPLVCLISGYNLSQIYYIYNLFACLDINNLRTPLFCFPQWYIPISKSVFFPSNHLFSSFLLSSHSPLFYFFASFLLCLLELQYKKYHKVDDL